MRRRAIRIASVALFFAVVVLAVAFNALALQEAYGDGPPYYGRTANMDKWESPLPILLPADAGVLALIGICAAWLRRTR
ncbi:hypothetical protein G3N92_10465 [Burkholderia sp. Ac-20379]|nr:hypothetical protein [Burkholderia sp. Ac-20379]